MIARVVPGDGWRQILVGASPQIATRCLTLIRQVLFLPTLPQLECGGRQRDTPFFHVGATNTAQYTAELYLSIRFQGLRVFFQLYMFCKLVLCVFIRLHYPTSQFKLCYGSCSSPYIRRLDIDSSPSTPVLEVTRWHQTCICKNTFALHRVCQLMFAFWCAASDHGRKSLPKILHSACPSLRSGKRARCTKSVPGGLLKALSNSKVREQTSLTYCALMDTCHITWLFSIRNGNHATRIPQSESHRRQWSFDLCQNVFPAYCMRQLCEIKSHELSLQRLRTVRGN